MKEISELKKQYNESIIKNQKLEETIDSLQIELNKKK